ncbi:hypothetical protein ELQ35_12995 [Peribacillus cavernae]|uniref:Cytosolic protein n=1 Tax=Peribacillus cavernae TaxID=1674310 RepID=A0A3S0VHM5_9BACI|nr:DUF6282 family protein [Peribacillus cavernae]MDQ0217682.1 hypothetical protein [Peribacillus cavernae]RUQ28153.1 hypothetical protein ELQ35_12995 [Peribacillus cavernae]
MDFHFLLKGAIELHCHSYPSIFPRKQTDWELIEDVKKANMSGVVLKAHEASTVDRATLIRLKEPGLHVYGGLVLNQFTGGLSPQAVDAAIRQGAKIIWMPTISANQHCCHFGQKKTRFFNSDRPLGNEGDGLTILDESKQLKQEVHEILTLIGEADITLATGHLSTEEVVILIDAAKEHHIEKILIQHADLGIAPVPINIQKQLAKKGAIIEKCYLACSEDFKDLSLAQMAESIREIGAESCVLVTDYGQDHNIPPIEALSHFVEEMLEAGITSREIETMIVHNPRKLLGIKDEVRNNAGTAYYVY